MKSREMLLLVNRTYEAYRTGLLTAYEISLAWIKTTSKEEVIKELEKKVRSLKSETNTPKIH